MSEGRREEIRDGEWLNPEQAKRLLSRLDAAEAARPRGGSSMDAYNCHKCHTRHSVDNMVAYCAVCYAEGLAAGLAEGEADVEEARSMCVGEAQEAFANLQRAEEAEAKLAAAEARIKSFEESRGLTPYVEEVVKLREKNAALTAEARAEAFREIQEYAQGEADKHGHCNSYPEAVADDLGHQSAYEDVARWCEQKSLSPSKDEAGKPAPDAKTDGEGRKPRPPIVCLCGSTRFMDAFFEAGWEFALRGYIVLSVGVCKHADAEGGHGAEAIGQDVADRLDELHKRKIDLADEVFVLNVDGYIGKSTRGEIDYAEAHGKPVKYLIALGGGAGMGEGNKI